MAIVADQYKANAAANCIHIQLTSRELLSLSRIISIIILTTSKSTSA